MPSAAEESYKLPATVFVITIRAYERSLQAAEHHIGEELRSEPVLLDFRVFLQPEGLVITHIFRVVVAIILKVGRKIPT